MKSISGNFTVISLKILILNFSTLWEVTSELDGGYASEEKFRYRKNSEVPDTLNSNLANLRMIPHFIREAMNDILETNVSDQIKMSGSVVGWSARVRTLPLVAGSIPTQMTIYLMGLDTFDQIRKHT